ncbi:uncharacterized protein [Halyomorpha halys]|uniref:uncharacterized protein n=1 Tax=Halyomorpha halys TaxID=286706 RepID=UPI0006D4DD66|nr:uncharacterized protein LOC106681615 [Halyomorpha halys]
MPINKSMIPAEELSTVALATIAERYPEPEWIHIFTDGSATETNKNVGAGVYSSLFQLSAPAGANATNFDGEVAAITLALEKLTLACAKKIVLLARLGVSQPQPLLPITMDMAKEMARRAEERSRGECGGKNWAALLDPKRRPPLTLPRKVAVACFRLATGHDYLTLWW